MFPSCYCITRHCDIFLHGYAHYAFASTIEFHSESHPSDRNNNSVWQNCDQRRRIAREATDRQSPPPSLSVRGNVPKNERRDFARENNHRYLCRFASTGVLTATKRFFTPLFVFDPHRRIHTCVFCAEFTYRNEENIFPAPSKEEEKDSL